MKNLGKIGLYIASLLGLIGFFWTVFTLSGAEDDATRRAEDFANLGIGFFLYIGLLIVGVSLVLFILYKVTDIIKHPNHLRELLFLFGIIIGAVLLGFVFTSFAGWIEGTIMAFIILLVLSFGFLIFDTIRSIIK